MFPVVNFLKCVATEVIFNLLLRRDISQGSVATHELSWDF